MVLCLNISGEVRLFRVESQVHRIVLVLQLLLVSLRKLIECGTLHIESSRVQGRPPHLVYLHDVLVSLDHKD